ncbi:MAG: RibD family protein [Spirochaetia bacterium]|jgi:riboflavin-specific deaminase-like protein|nr:RibD family protein [Spirochaetia bacterium]
MNEESNLSEWLNRPQVLTGERRKPLVLISYASSLDGSISVKQGSQFTISSDESMKTVHYLRSRCDAILVGIGTILSDNPQLSVRLVSGKDPVPVIIDSSLRTPSDSRVFLDSRNPLIFCGRKPDSGRKNKLLNKGAFIIETDNNEETLSLTDVLFQLYDRGIRSLMVEGGAKIIRSFIKESLWDKMAVSIAPSLIGGYRIITENTLTEPVRFNNVSWIRKGSDQICLIERETS